MAAKRSVHGGFSKGMLRDIAPWESPEGYCWNAVDMLCDIEGKIRKRGGYTSPSATSRTAVVENLLAFRSGAVDGITGLFGSTGKSIASVYYIDRTTGAATNVAFDGTLPTRACRPFQHRNYGIFPFQSLTAASASKNGLIVIGGSQRTGVSGATLTGAVATAGDNRITAITGVSMVAGMEGCILEMESASRVYSGRIIEIISTSSVRVEPTPLFAITGAVSGRVDSGITPGPNWNAVETSGRFGVSYQGRIVQAYTLNIFQLDIAKGTPWESNRVAWSPLETDPITSHVANADGEQILYPPDQPTYNWVDIPDLQGITGLAVAGEGNLIVFGRNKTYRISGDLTTETIENPTFGFTVSQVSANVGCITDRSIQYARAGLIFVGYDNLYAYDGAQMRPLLTGTNAKYLQGRLRAGDLILGSAYSANTNHYYLSMSGSEGGLLFNLDGMQMTKLTNIVLFDSAPDPTDATKLWGLKWWNTGGAAPSQVAGPILGMESIWLPSSANVADGDATNVTPVWESKAFIDGAIETLKRYTQFKIGYDLRYGAGVATASLFADTVMNTADASYVNLSSTLGTLPETPTEPGQKGFRALPLLPKGQAVALKLTATACDSFEILTVETEVQELRAGRSA